MLAGRVFQVSAAAIKKEHRPNSVRDGGTIKSADRSRRLATELTGSHIAAM
jgi:hypothetical protein